MKKYEDIISLPHHVSDHHPQMSIHDRAAQFSPFAALTGYGDAVEETARLTSQKKILDETEREALDRQLASLAGLLEESRKADGRRGRVPRVRITYFLPDREKERGSLHETVRSRHRPGLAAGGDRYGGWDADPGGGCGGAGAVPDLTFFL